jgi:DegV family protein with EDD domain
MSRVAVVTDTTQYLPREVIERHGLELVSLYVNWDGRTDREAELGDYGPFYDHLRSSRDLPSTSQPSVGDFLAVYEPLIEDGADILSIHLSGGISGTVRSAEQARDALVERGVAAERVVVLDSRTGCAGHGVMAIAAANAAAGGADVQGAAAAANALRETMTILFAVDTLEFLRRGGRIGAAQALLGSALKIKPILSIEGEIFPVERVRTAGRAADRLMRELQERRDEGADVFFVQHVQAPDVAARLSERGAEIYGRGPEFVSEIGPVIGTHTGPGLVGVMGLRSELLGPV